MARTKKAPNRADALYVNIKVSGRIAKRAAYAVLGINTEGNKDLLGL